MDPQDKPSVSEDKSYGKKIFTAKNIIIYLVIASVVYAAVYFLFIAKKGSSGYMSKQNSEQQSQSNPPTDANADVVVVLEAQNNSGEAGVALISNLDGMAKVALQVSGAAEGANQPAHIHEGKCPGVGAVKYKLKNVTGGVSETVLDVAFEELRNQTPLAINVHKSEAEATTYVACGQIAS